MKPAIRRIVSITGSRADYGLMEPVHRAIGADRRLQLNLIVTGMHFAPEFSSSLERVREDKLGPLHEVPIPVAEDSMAGMASSIGLMTAGIADRLSEIKPDILLLQGDRGEMLAAAIAAAHMNIPIVHMSGGDFSGSIDDSIRNAISKLAHIHLTTCDSSSQRLISMGEIPERIFEVGEPGLDVLKSMKPISRAELAAEFDLRVDRPYFLATLHPVTFEADRAEEQMRTVLEALAEIGTTTVFTQPNTDHGGQAMGEMLEAWRDKPFLRIHPDLGSQRYLSLMRHAAAVVGNSSSGILEAPSLKVPVVNVGSRQENRLRAENVIDVPFDRSAITKAIRFVLEDENFRKRVMNCKNPYGDGETAPRVIDVVSRLKLNAQLLVKHDKPSGDFLAAPVHGI